ncbi:MAG TPA: histidine phosphatase family protein [Rhizomicrobium sp.]|nr:histidine phosphatase family protein [Rhizomicrobium sp.]
MKRLLLLRHAKAVRDSADGDHERELNARGRANAATLGAFLQKSGLAPDLVLCSTAKRTVETWELVAEELGLAAKVEFLDALYLASAKKIQTIVRNAAGGTLLVIAHNPGIEECAAELARKSAMDDEAARLDNLRQKYPTCALAVLEFEIAGWKELAPSSGVLAAFVRPKDLE